MKYIVEHLTEYQYAYPVSLSYNDACLSLRSCPTQAVQASSWQITPEPNFRKIRSDIFGNIWQLLTFDQPLLAMSLNTKHEVEVFDPHVNGLPDSPSLSALAATVQQQLLLDPMVAPFLWNSSYVRANEAFAQYGRACFNDGRPFLQGVMDLTTQIYQDFDYAPQSTTVSTPVEEIFQTKRGVCQDYAHFSLSVLRSLGIPARYVSGYLHTAPARNGTVVRGADASHAWIAVYNPPSGWVDFDPTNGLLVRDGHITIAWGRDYADVTPLKGVVLGGGSQTLKVAVTVEARS